MTYTFWHAGILIGTSELDHPSRNPGQHAGVFHPTAHGLALFPRLTGVLTAGHAMKNELAAMGTSPDAMSPDEMGDYLESSPSGRKMLDLGRVLSDVVVKGPDDESLAFSSIAFSDLRELQQLTRALAPATEPLPEDLPPDAPRYIVSATFRAGEIRGALRLESDGRRWRPPWSERH